MPGKTVPSSLDWRLPERDAVDRRVGGQPRCDILQRYAGYLFGREVPALLVYEPAKQYPIDVYPHRTGSRTVTIRAFLGGLVNTLKKAPAIVEGRRPDRALVERMDRLREKIGPIGVRVVELIREGRGR